MTQLKIYDDIYYKMTKSEIILNYISQYFCYPDLQATGLFLYAYLFVCTQVYALLQYLSEIFCMLSVWEAVKKLSAFGTNWGKVLIKTLFGLWGSRRQ